MLKIYTPNTRESIIKAHEYRVLSTVFNMERESIDDADPETLRKEVLENRAVILTNGANDFVGRFGMSSDSGFFKSPMCIRGVASIDMDSRVYGKQCIEEIIRGADMDAQWALGLEDQRVRVFSYHNPEGHPPWIGNADEFSKSEQYDPEKDYFVYERPKCIQLIVRYYLTATSDAYGNLKETSCHAIMHSEVEEPLLVKQISRSYDYARSFAREIYRATHTPQYYSGIYDVTNYNYAYAVDIAIDTSGDSHFVGIDSVANSPIYGGDAFYVKNWLKHRALFFLDNL